MPRKFKLQRREIRNRVGLLNSLFWIAFFLTVGLRTMQATVLSSYLPHSILTIGIAVSSALIIVKLFFLDRMSHQQLFIMTLIFFTTFIVSKISNVNSLFSNIILVLGCLEIPFKRIAKNYVVIVSIILGIAYLTTLVGLTKNYSVLTSDGVKYAMGGTYPTDFAAHIFYLLCAYIYSRAKKINILDLGVLVAGFLLVKYITKTQADTVAIFVLIMVVIIYCFQNRIMKSTFARKLYTTTVRWIFLLPLIFAVGICWLTWSFNYVDKTFIHLNSLFTNRLNIGNQAFVAYGIKLFGQPVIQYGWGGTRTSIFGSGLGSLTYFFIDSSYVSMLIVYGLFFTILVLFGLMYHLYKKLESNHILYVLIWIPILLVSVIDQHLLEIQYNIFMLGIFAYFTQNTESIFLSVPKISIKELRRL